MAEYGPAHWMLCQLPWSQSDIFRGNEGSLYWASCAQQAGTSNKWELEETLLRCSFEGGNRCRLKLNHTKLDKER